MDEIAEDVLARRAFALGHVRGEVALQFEPEPRHFELALAREREAERLHPCIAPALDARRILGRETEAIRDHVDRQRRGETCDQLALVHPAERVREPRHDRAQSRLARAHAARGERRIRERAKAAVLWRIRLQLRVAREALAR